MGNVSLYDVVPPVLLCLTETVFHCFNLFQSNLQVLMDGLKSFISEQNKANLEAALTRLKEDLMLDASKINQLSTALWIFQVLIGIT